MFELINIDINLQNFLHNFKFHLFLDLSLVFIYKEAKQ
jgi:hypothetical protein